MNTVPDDEDIQLYEERDFDEFELWGIFNLQNSGQHPKLNFNIPTLLNWTILTPTTQNAKCNPATLINQEHE